MDASVLLMEPYGFIDAKNEKGYKIVGDVDYNSVILFVHVPKSGGSSVRENLIKY